MATKTKKTTTKPKMTKAELEQRTIERAEAKLVERYGSRIVKGSVKRGTGKYANKLTVEINTLGVDGKPDGNTRRVATSDVFQVKHMPEVAAELAKTAAAERRKAKAKATASA